MNKLFTLKLVAIQAIITSSTAIFAHDGHSLSGSHWHASDVFGFVILAAAIGVAFWFGRGGK
jgi:predicted alpha/beta hydrolase